MKETTPAGIVLVLAAALLWGTTGTAAAMAPDVGPLAIGAAAMGVGGLLQSAAANRSLFAHRGGLTAQWRTVMLSAGAVALYPLAFYSSMRLAGVAVGTVVSIGSAPPAAAVIERIVDRRPLSRGWVLGTAVGLSGVLALALAHPDEPGTATITTAPQPALGVGLGLLAGFTYALYSWGAARVMRQGLPSRTVMGAVFGLGGFLLLPVLALTGGPILTSGRHLAVVTYLAVVPMFLGYLLFGRGLATVAASTATTGSLLEPATAALIAVIVLRERLPPVGWLGLGLLFTSLAITAISTRPASTSRPDGRSAKALDRAPTHRLTSRGEGSSTALPTCSSTGTSTGSTGT
jgi:drug/metabolite transporter, DME family